MVNTVLLAVCTVLSAIIIAGGGVWAARITAQVTANTRRMDDIHGQLKTSNGNTIAQYVEQIATKDDTP